MMRHSLVFLALATVFVGCRTNTEDPWFSPGLATDAIDAVTVVSSSYALDGGTTTLFLVTDTRQKCIVRLNQHQMDPFKDPGRLFFNDQMIDVRSPEEAKIIALLQAAEFDSVVSASVTHGKDISGRDGAVVSEIEVADGDVNDDFRKLRDSIVRFLQSDKYVAMANRGYVSQTFQSP
jgi:hypothetical protein